MTPAALIAASTLFPSFWYTQMGLGAFGRDLSSELTAPLSFRDPLGGVDVSWRNSFSGQDPERALIATSGRFRLFFGDGTVQIDDLTLGSQGLVLRSRPPMGESFDLGVGGHQVEYAFAWGDSGRMQTRAFVPATLIPLGLANTDQDGDDRLKYYFRAGAGVGGDFVVAISGSGDLLFAARGLADYRYTWRAGSESFSHNRGDVDLAAEVSLGFRQGDGMVMLTLWGTDRLQWDYDLVGSEVNRQHHAAGFRVERREYRRPKPPPPPAAPPAAPPPKPPEPRPLAIPGPKDPPPPPPQ